MVQITNPVKMFGIYVQSLSVNIGWSGQGGTLQMRLVEDEDNDVVLDKDAFGNPSEFQVGTACYFKYGGFYFGGILQRWTYNHEIGGRTYDIILESPAKLMDGVQVIYEDWTGATDLFANQFDNYESSTNINSFHMTYWNKGSASVRNVFNVFGYYENQFYGSNGAYKNFGNSGVNTDGLQVSKLIDGMVALIDKNSSNTFGGAMAFGTGEDNQTLYSLDCTDLLQYKDDSYRLKGPSNSINGVISKLADLFQFDYYYSILPDTGVPSADGGGKIDSATIKIHTVDKGEPPEPNKIRSFISAELAKPDSSKKLLSYQIGKEFGDTVTQKVVWGGRRTRYVKIGGLSDGDVGHNVKVSDTFAVFGRTPVAGDRGWALAGTVGSVYGRPANPFPIYLEGIGTYKVTPFEMRFAMGGKECWEMFKTFETLAGVEANNYNDINTCPWTGGIDVTPQILDLLLAARVSPLDLTTTRIGVAAKQWEDARNRLADRIYAGVVGVASRSYCQEFIIPMPSERYEQNYNLYQPADEYELWKAWELSSSAYDSLPCAFDIEHFDDVGRARALCGWPVFSLSGVADFSALGSNYSLGTNAAGGRIVSSLGGPAFDEAIWGGPYFNNRWLVKFSAGAQVKLHDAITTPDFGLTVLASYFFGKSIPSSAYITLGKTSLQFACPPDCLLPSFFGIPQESSRLNYGPWLTLNSQFSPTGKAEVIQNEALRPETYGSHSALQAVGNTEAAVSPAARMHESESGYVELAGAPSWNLGERFASTGAYVTSMAISIDVSGGVKTTYQFNTWTPQFGTMNKYNADRIANINKRTFEFAKKNRQRVERKPLPSIPFGENGSGVGPGNSNRFNRPDIAWLAAVIG